VKVDQVKIGHFSRPKIVSIEGLSVFGGQTL
jgi:hypothetical protein